MKDVLVYIELIEDGVRPSSREAVSAGREIASATGGSVIALIASGEPVGVPTLDGVDRIIHVTHPALGAYTAEAHAAVLADMIAKLDPAAVMLAYTTAGLDLASAVAVTASLPLVAYCTDVTVADGALTTTSQMYGGRLEAVVRAPLPVVVSIMPGAFPEAVTTGASPEIIVQDAPKSLDALRSVFVDEQRPARGSFDLSLAERIVCIGRGIGAADSIAVARELADALNAEIAGSRPVIDQGWLEKERQVGKSGRLVKPRLYIGLGVSGAPEHLEGMRSSDLIIAVNSDAAAPIFTVAHYGAVCDMFDLVPALIERLKAGTP